MKDRLFQGLLYSAAILVILLTASIVYALIGGSMGAFGQFGFWHFISSTHWDPLSNNFGALPFIVGSLMTSVLALLFCIPFSLSVALFNGEYFKRTKISYTVSVIVDLLAGIPSIVFGLWGFYVLRPLLISSGVSDQGLGILLSSIVLAIMIIPYASSLSGEFIGMVPKELKEGAYALGATQMEVIKYVTLPKASSGIFAAYVLAFGRALGETMAVTMLIGNTSNIPTSLTDTGNTMASIIANQFGEAGGIKLSALFAIGLLLFLITALINLAAKSFIKILNR
ncbi:phosphate ABC transporter permease subunit PstC [Falsiporphyromonas endometrii]|uniref:Phosphate transport system permease protein n=1 Tax=Falsiporphyromonas endometrii TaxID=1387297 RepID=A0ABV9K6T0_9PORP